MTVYVQLDENEVITDTAPIVRKFIGQSVMNLLDWLRGTGAPARMYRICHWPVVLVCGGRDYDNQSHVFQVLDMFHQCSPIELIVHGDARGADRLADEWAEFREVPVAAYPADWEKHGKAAGFIRNAQMLKAEKPNCVIAFPGGAGTTHMMSLAQKQGIPVHAIQDIPTSVRTKANRKNAVSEADPPVRQRRTDTNKAHSKRKGKSRS